MGLTQITIPKRLSMEWPHLIERAGCNIEEGVAHADIKTPKANSKNISELLEGRWDYWANIITENARASLAFLKRRSQSDVPDYKEDCIISECDRSKNNLFLIPSLYYLFISSGAFISTGGITIVKNVHIFRAAPDIRTMLMKSAISLQIKLSLVWEATSPISRKAEVSCPFCLMHAECSKELIEIWLGPSIASNGDNAMFVAVRSKRRFRSDKRNPALSEILHLLKELGAEEITGFLKFTNKRANL